MRKLSFMLAALLAVAGVCVMLWPVVTGHTLQTNADEAVQNFLEERKPEQQYPELLADLQAYNQRIYDEKQSGLVDLEACEAPAADLTAYGVEDEIIGVLEIPANVVQTVLDRTIGHIGYGDALHPILIGDLQPPFQILRRKGCGQP